MLNLSPIYILVRSFPESILLALAAFIILDIKIDIKKIIKLGMLLGIVVAAVRLLPISFGVHTIMFMFIYGFMIKKYFNKNVMYSIIVSCGVFIALAISEGIYLNIATKMIGIDYNSLIQTNFEGAMKSLPSLLIFILIIVISKKFMYIKSNQKG